MTLSSSDKICIRCGESSKELDTLNHMGARYRDNQLLKTILEQAHV